MKQQTQIKEYFKKGRYRLVLSLFLTVLHVLLTLSYPLVLAFVVDSLLLGKTPKLPAQLLAFYEATGGRTFYLKNIWLIGLLLFLLVSIQAVVQYSRNILMSRFAQDGTLSLRKALFCHLQRLP